MAQLGIFPAVIYPSLQAPPFVPGAEVVTLDKWYQENPPILRYPAFLTGGGLIGSVTEVDDILMSTWWQQPSEPVRQRKAIWVGLQQALAFVAQPPETITLDKWYEQWPDQRPRKSRHAALRASGFIDPTGGFIPAEVVTLDKWYAPLSTPKRFRLSFNASLQQFFWYDPTTPVPPPSPPPPPPPPVDQDKGGGKHPKPRRLDGPVLPQQVIDDVAALYRLIYENRRSLSADLVGKITGLVYAFAENWDGRLPPPSAIHWRDLVQYPDIDLSVLTEAADFIIALPTTQPEQTFTGQPGWASVAKAGAVDRAMERLRRDAQVAAIAARAADEQDEEDALLALLMVL